MPIINQAAKSVHSRLPTWMVLGTLSTYSAVAATKEELQLPVWNEIPATTLVAKEAEELRIIEIYDPGDGTLGTVLFGEGTSENDTSSRRGPR
jgi:hypothetical protein